MTHDVPLSDLMAHAPTSRAAMWRLCAQIADRPTPQFVDELRSGKVVERIEASTHWLGDTFDVATLIGPLEAFVKRSARFSAERDLSELEAEWQRCGEESIVELCLEEERQARGEAAAWAEGDIEAAKASRASQIRQFTPKLETLMGWCRKAHDNSELLVWRALIRVVVSHAGVEGAKDLLTEFDDPTRRLSLGF